VFRSDLDREKMSVPRNEGDYFGGNPPEIFGLGVGDLTFSAGVALVRGFVLFVGAEADVVFVGPGGVFAAGS
jgi:hypothetical protein